MTQCHIVVHLLNLSLHLKLLMHTEHLNTCQTNFKSLFTFCYLWNTASFPITESPYEILWTQKNWLLIYLEINLAPIFLKRTNFKWSFLTVNCFTYCKSAPKFEFHNFNNVVIAKITKNFSLLGLFCKYNLNWDCPWPSSDSVETICSHGISRLLLSHIPTLPWAITFPARKPPWILQSIHIKSETMIWYVFFV